MGRGWGTASSNSEARAQAAKDEHGDREQLWGHRHHHGSLEGTEEGSTTPDEVSSLEARPGTLLHTDSRNRSRGPTNQNGERER